MTLNLDKSTWKRVAFGDVIESVSERVDDPSAAGVDRYVGHAREDQAAALADVVLAAGDRLLGEPASQEDGSRDVEPREERGALAEVE